MEKSYLRKECVKSRNAMCNEDWRSKSAQICSFLSDYYRLHLYHLRDFALYSAVNNEPSITPFAQLLLTDHKCVAFPLVVDKQSSQMHFSCITNIDTDLKRGAYGILEPVTSTLMMVPDVVVCPCVAANKDLYRLGMGGGFYDRLVSNTQAVKIGILFSAYKDQEFISDEWDLRLDVLVTEDGIIAQNNNEQKH